MGLDTLREDGTRGQRHASAASQLSATLDAAVNAGYGGLVDRAERARWLAPSCEHAEPRRRIMAELRVLLGPGERKHIWQMTEWSGNATPYGMQPMLRRMRWDADAVRNELHTYVVEPMGDPTAVLIIDETGILKKSRPE